MNNLIRAELFKLQRNKTFWVLILTITGLSTLLHYLIMSDWWQMTGTAFDQAGLSELNALATFTVPLFFNIIVSTLAGFFISAEFSNSGVIKNQVLSGQKRSHIYIAKFLVFSLGAFIITILLPLLTGLILIVLLGHGELLNGDNLIYLVRAFSLFTIHFMCFTAVVLWIAITTEDNGKTILFTLILSIVMFIFEQTLSIPIIKTLYGNTFCYQFTEVLNSTMTHGGIIKSIVIGVISFLIIMFCGLYMFNRKEIK